MRRKKRAGGRESCDSWRQPRGMVTRISITVKDYYKLVSFEWDTWKPCVWKELAGIREFRETWWELLTHNPGSKNEPGHPPRFCWSRACKKTIDGHGLVPALFTSSLLAISWRCWKWPVRRSAFFHRLFRDCCGNSSLDSRC